MIGLIKMDPARPLVFFVYCLNVCCFLWNYPFGLSYCLKSVFCTSIKHPFVLLHESGCVLGVCTHSWVCLSVVLVVVVVRGIHNKEMPAGISFFVFLLIRTFFALIWLQRTYHNSLWRKKHSLLWLFTALKKTHTNKKVWDLRQHVFEYSECAVRNSETCMQINKGT